MADILDEVVSYLLRDTDDANVVVGPALWNDDNGPARHYFVVATSEIGRGFRCDSIEARNADENLRNRRDVIAALMAAKPIVIHDCAGADELYMARLCETLWPGERIRRPVRTVESERQ